MFTRRDSPHTWAEGTATVEPLADSPRPMWVLKARRGRRHWIDLAGGPLETRRLAATAADELNALHRDAWDPFILRQLPRIIAAAHP